MPFSGSGRVLRGPLDLASEESSLAMSVITPSNQRPPVPVSSTLALDAPQSNAFSDTGLSVNINRRGYWLISVTLKIDHDAPSGNFEGRLVCGADSQPGLIVLGSATALGTVSSAWVYKNTAGIAAKIQGRKAIAAGTCMIKQADSRITAAWLGS
jgi:hypothetical protein